MTQTHFPASRHDGLQRMSDFILAGRAGKAYAQRRNFDEASGQHPHVSTLSPYLRHRLILETEVLKAVLKVESPESAEKFIQEIAWRTYWKGWMENHPPIWQDYLHQLAALESQTAALHRALDLACSGQTGLECFDVWCKELTDTGYLHNHARMWFASIWIFTLGLPWPWGARFFMQHLCDADPASNTLSWRWVAGLHTKGKHYLARAENIARYTAGRFNPVSQLREDAPALVEKVAPVMSQPETMPWQYFQQATQGSGRPAVLLLHEEDLAPENESPIDNVEGLILLTPGHKHGPIAAQGGPADQDAGAAFQFRQQAFRDAVERVGFHYRVEAHQIMRLESPSDLSRENIARQFPGCELVTRAIPVGPCRDRLKEPLQALRDAGQSVIVLPRPWDQQSWPHTGRGFFNYKSRIGGLLRDLCQ